MKIMTKIKDLLAGREKMKKYDELTAWKSYFGEEDIYFSNGLNSLHPLPDHIKGIIISALDAEIAKLDEE